MADAIAETHEPLPLDHWFVALDSRELRRGRPLGIRRFGLDLVLWRDEAGAPRCVGDRCPHRGAALSAGKVRAGAIECPFHGFQFDGDGACVVMPCHGEDPPSHVRARAFAVAEAHGFVWIWWGERRERYPQVPWFDELDSRYEYAGFAIDTDIHWTRNVENQLDWAHLPFVHRTTIGARFPRKLEIGSRVVGDLLETWPVHEVRPDGAIGFKISFMFPNLWMMPVGAPRQRSVIAFAPIDHERSRLYVRTYTRSFPLKGLARAASWMTGFANRVILGQDLRVVETQPRGATVGVKDERLVQVDLPIAQFRKELRRRARRGEPARDVEAAS
ncbi:MAG: aromatic ring-hydroxylating dioxygenase subunit alpha [Nannocystaceae bacterium]|nr:aromatic ring-hydroxylating dioxygenase subunit alpha [Myxococcales bacterium]